MLDDAVAGRLELAVIDRQRDADPIINRGAERDAGHDSDTTMFKQAHGIGVAIHAG